MSKISENKWTRSNRKTVVVSSHVSEWTPGTLAYPRLDQLSDFPSDSRIRKAVAVGESIWCLTTRKRTGLDAVKSDFSLFPTKNEAEQAIQPNGTFSDPEAFFAPDVGAFEVGSLSTGTQIAVAGLRGGEPPFGVVYDALHGAGAYENFSLSRKVIDWVGAEGQEWLNSEYGENWECVALYEYCLAHFPSSSLATISARIMVAYFVAYNDFDVGYASRELLMLATGAEEEAQAALERKMKAAKASAKKSADKKMQRLDTFMDMIETTYEENPAFRSYEEMVLRTAFDQAVPKGQYGHGQYESYASEIRSVEPYKTRFDKLFRKVT